VPNVRLGVRAGHARGAEVLDRFAVRLGPAEEHDVLARGGGQRELVEGHALTTRLHDARARSFGESKRAHLKRGHFEHAAVVRHGADNRGDLPGTLIRHELREFRQGQRRAVDLGHEQTLENGVVDVIDRRCSASQEPVKLHEELEVHVFGLGRGAVLDLVPAARFDVDPLGWLKRRDMCRQLIESGAR